MKIQVQCSAEPGEGATPQVLFIGQRHIGVLETIDHWPDAERTYFKVRCTDDATYFIRYETGSVEWSLFLFQDRNC